MRALALLLALAPPAGADTLVAARLVPAHAVLGPDDIGLSGGDTPGALAHPDEALGQEARVVLYPGRPIMAADLGAPALVERNQVVALVYRRGPLLIATEARALGRAGAGEPLRVMNLASKSTVTGRVDARGRVIVGTVNAGLAGLEAEPETWNDLEDMQ